MAAAEIPLRPPLPAYLVKVASKMCPAVLGWKNGGLLRGRENSLGMERPIVGVLITGEIIFYDEMYMEHDPVYGHKAWKANLEEKSLTGRMRLRTIPSHYRVLLTSVNSNYPTKFRLQ